MLAHLKTTLPVTFGVLPLLIGGSRALRNPVGAEAQA